jgi:hypothetical protein
MPQCHSTCTASPSPAEQQTIKAAPPRNGGGAAPTEVRHTITLRRVWARIRAE